MPTSLRPSRAATTLGVAVLLSLAACKKDEVTHYRVAKPAAAPPSAAPPDAPAVPATMTGDVPPAAKPTGSEALRWTLPAGWTEAQGGGGMRLATFKPPAGAGTVDVSVIVLPGPAGGELANVNRWRNQIGLAPIDDAALAQARQVVRAKAGPVHVYDFASEAAGKRVVGGLTEVEGNTWFVKMSGDAAAVERARPDFLRLLESLRRE